MADMDNKYYEELEQIINKLEAIEDDTYTKNVSRRNRRKSTIKKSHARVKSIHNVGTTELWCDQRFFDNGKKHYEAIVKPIGYYRNSRTLKPEEKGPYMVNKGNRVRQHSTNIRLEECKNKIDEYWSNNNT